VLFFEQMLFGLFAGLSVGVAFNPSVQQMTADNACREKRYDSD
jgi:hypothetical protein